MMGDAALQPVVRGLRLTGGAATGLGGHPAGDAGGGYVRGASVTLSDNQVFSNTAQFGGAYFSRTGRLYSRAIPLLARRSWGFASSRCVVGLPPRGNGVWYVWLST